MYFILFLIFIFSNDFILENFQRDGLNNPHENRFLLPQGCKSCHKSHSKSKEYLKKAEEPDLCFKCHGTLKDIENSLYEGLISNMASPKSVISSFAFIYSHPISDGCTSCHRIHRKKEKTFEYEFCKECHSNNPFYKNPLSFHPIFLFTSEKDSQDCSTCHSAVYKGSPFGVHGSNYKGIIFSNYEREDDIFKEDSYSFCFTCHEKEKIFYKSFFPYHQNHVVKYSTSCYTCHDSHASLNLPFLLTFEEETRNDRIFPTSEGIKKYISLGKGKGICYLTCHGVEHNGISYGFEIGYKKEERLLKRKNLEDLKKGKVKR